MAAQIVACGFGPIACVGAAGALTLASGGSIGSAIQAMAMGAFNIGVWSEVGAFLEPLKALGTGGFALVKGAVHGAVGGAMAVLQGGKFVEGFAANAIGGMGGVFSGAISQNNVIVDTMLVAAVGGTASVVSGGKFANGAVTAAFAYLYNQAAHNGRDPNHRHELGRREAMADAEKNGYEIFRRTPTKVSLLGLPSRIYDFVVRDPVSNQQIGVEVKTSWLETIFLNMLQVNFDVAVVKGTLGPALGSGGVSIIGVQYYTYCFQCSGGEGQMRSYVLEGRLELAGIPTYRGRRLSY